MFGFLAALTSFVPKQREGRDALIFENYIRTGQGLPGNRVYRESAVDKQARKELAAIRSRERLQQQIKFVRLMKKLLIKADRDGETDEELEQMRVKVAQIEAKIEKAARAKEMSCEDMFDMDMPDDAYDIQLEQLVQRATLNVAASENVQSRTINEECRADARASGDNRDISSPSIVNYLRSDTDDECVAERPGKAKCN